MVGPTSWFMFHICLTADHCCKTQKFTGFNSTVLRQEIEFLMDADHPCKGIPLGVFGMEAREQTVTVEHSGDRPISVPQLIIRAGTSAWASYSRSCLLQGSMQNEKKTLNCRTILAT